MRKATVKALSVGGRRKVHHSGDTVYETSFPEGQFDKLIADGHLSEAEEATPTEAKKAPVATFDGPEQTFGVDQKPKTPVKDVPKEEETEEKADDQSDQSTLTVEQLKKELTERGVKFPTNAKKDDLLKLWASGQ